MRMPAWFPARRDREAVEGCDGLAMTVPRPADRHVPVRVGGEGEPLRLLLFGSGPAAGWGVRERAEGLTGALARATAERTGRPVEVVPVIDDYWHESDPVRALQEAGLADYDAVLAISAYRWSLVDVPLALWRSYVDRLRDVLLAEAGRDAVVQVLALPWWDAALRDPDRWGGALGRKIERLASEAAESVRPCAGVGLLELEPPADAAEWCGPAFSAATYARWGGEAADVLVPRLAAVRAG